jgi:rod shape-determining protein MreD
MIRILALSLSALGLVILQTSLVELFTADRLSLEFTTVAVIYAALFMETWQGAWLTFLLGYFMDALVSPFPGLYVLSYGAIFFALSSISTRVYSTKMLFLVSVTFLSVLAEGIILVSIYYILYDMNVLTTGLKIYLPQACILSGLSPILYDLFRRLDGHGNGKREQQTQQP